MTGLNNRVEPSCGTHILFQQEPSPSKYSESHAQSGASCFGDNFILADCTPVAIRAREERGADTCAKAWRHELIGRG